MQKLQFLLRFKYVVLVVAMISLASCASSYGARKCNGVKGQRVPMGIM